VREPFKRLMSAPIADVAEIRFIFIEHRVDIAARIGQRRSLGVIPPMKIQTASLAAFASIVFHGFAQSPPTASTAAASSGESRTYDVIQSVTLNDIPKGAKSVGLWVSIPDDGPAQRVLDLSVTSAPGPWKLVRDKDRACRFLYVDIAKPKSDTVTTTVFFSVHREAVSYKLDPTSAVPLPNEQKALFTDELRLDSPHMEVTDQIRKIVRETCGDEKNPVIVAEKLLNYVADNADHYSKNSNVPICSVGDAGSCIAKGGGCCTDLHSLFIATARAAGIPARLQMGYRLQPKNLGVEADPGYRCWVEYFISGSGWIPADIVEADAGDATGRARWFTGLTECRVHLNEGRDFDLPLKRNAARVNHMSIGYAEIDGKPVRLLPEGNKAAQLVRKVKYTERAENPKLSEASTTGR
jgi:transglutaminase-like putative cysteine protease